MSASLFMRQTSAEIFLVESELSIKTTNRGSIILYSSDCRYLKHTLDQYVENDYILVYFHHGLNSKNKPSFKWLRQAYREFDRK